MHQYLHCYGNILQIISVFVVFGQIETYHQIHFNIRDRKSYFQMLILLIKRRKKQIFKWFSRSGLIGQTEINALKDEVGLVVDAHYQYL